MPETSIDHMLQRELARGHRSRVLSWVLLAISIAMLAIGWTR